MKLLGDWQKCSGSWVPCPFLKIAQDLISLGRRGRAVGLLTKTRHTLTLHDHSKNRKRISSCSTFFASPQPTSPSREESGVIFIVFTDGRFEQNPRKHLARDFSPKLSKLISHFPSSKQLRRNVSVYNREEILGSLN